MDRFSRFNPKATLLFFIAETGLTIYIFNPVILALSFAAACVYKIRLGGKRAVSFIFKYSLPVIVLVALFNFIFTHYGSTVLFTVSDMSFTAQSLFYGFFQGLMLSAVILWFSIYSEIITAEKFLSVFSKTAPNLALIFSMVLSFIPRFMKNAEEISSARLLIDKEESRLRKSINNFSALITMTLEDSIETADSMKARGFGKKRSAYSKYRFSVKDLIMLVFIIAVTVLMTVLKAMDFFSFIFEPDIIMGDMPLYSLILFALLSLLPVITDLVEDVKWHYLRQKI